MAGPVCALGPVPVSLYSVYICIHNNNGPIKQDQEPEAGRGENRKFQP